MSSRVLASSMSVILEHVPFYRKLFAVSGFWKKSLLLIGLPYIQGDRMPADFQYKDLALLAKANGVKQISSVDLFDLNATYQWDLNKPVPKRFHDSFDTVFDIGTLEHIYDTRQCLENYLRLVAVGGIFALVTPVNGYFGHGFHVFNPHTIIDALEQNHFTIEYLAYSTSTGLEVTDPSIRKNMLLFIAARKKKTIKTFAVPQQQYWKDMYTVQTETYTDDTYKPSKLDWLTTHLKTGKRTLLSKLPLSTRTWLLKRV